MYIVSIDSYSASADRKETFLMVNLFWPEHKGRASPILFVQSQCECHRSRRKLPRELGNESHRWTMRIFPLGTIGTVLQDLLAPVAMCPSLRLPPD